ncbi:hypothetical protein [Photorhabdus caribbeanensis]|uniref:hypothetical protein n=1 Tax=Photorhabdus caribbeanensis TaxID=1004165 RepID=UPI00052B85A6|nr:hypothetical protein [Photorhabdus caribbeanensis]KGM27447.1 hypothetical protein KS18_15130 [Photorhabdus luminescens]MBS9426441.1 hypothetical protein [Photorhabdus caribbeanensis]
MKFIIYFLYWSLVQSVGVFITVMAVKLLVKFVLYFETGVFFIGYKDIVEAIGIGVVMGIFLGGVICLINYLQHKRF